MTVGIVYIVTGNYKFFWEDFYKSCQKYFCVDSDLMFYVFTEDPDSLTKCGPNVEFIKIEDKGWLLNVLSKSHFISNNKALLSKCDYLFYVNGNCVFIDTILTREVIPSQEQDYLVSLCYDYNENVAPEDFDYDRNPLSHAYIPFSQGSRYYQATFYGGRTKEMFELSDWCVEAIDDDLGKRIIAKWHDESYVNKYLLERNPKVLNSTHGASLPWATKCNIKSKVLFPNKADVLGLSVLRKIKECYLDSDLHFMICDDFIARPIAYVNVEGNLATSLFQISFFFYLLKNGERDRLYYLHISPQSHILELFPDLEQYLLPEGWYERIEKIEQPTSKLEVVEREDPYHLYSQTTIVEPIVTYYGLWQSPDYVDCLPAGYRNVLVEETEDREIEECGDCVVVGIYVSRQPDVNAVCDEKYYSEALNHIRDREPSKTLCCVIVSPDTEWVTEKYGALFSQYKHTYRAFDGDSADSFKRCLGVLRRCDYYVLNNSASGWWGACFNDKAYVISPSFWTNKSHSKFLRGEWFKVSPTPLRTRLTCEELDLILPVDVENPQHLSNLEYLSTLFDQFRGVTIHIVCGDASKLHCLSQHHSLDLKIHETEHPHSTAKYINYALDHSGSKYIVVWDIALMISPIDFSLAYYALKSDGETVINICGDKYVPEDYILNDFVSSGDFRYIIGGTHRIAYEGGLTLFFISRKNYLSIGAENENIVSKNYLNKDRSQRLSRWNIEQTDFSCNLHLLSLENAESERQERLESDLASYVETCRNL